MRRRRHGEWPRGRERIARAESAPPPPETFYALAIDGSIAAAINGDRATYEAMSDGGQAP